ncbi:MAG: hypothetical protein ACOCX2_11480, partial [Armatimonadota bacterium]
TLELTSASVLAGHDVLFAADEEQIAGQPVLVENRLGDGAVWLVTLWEYPADDAVEGLTRELLRVVSAGEQGEIRLLGSDRVRWAVYDLDDGAGQVIYLLNTDPDCAAPVRLWIEGSQTAEFIVPANEFMVAYRLGQSVVMPLDRRVDLKRAEARDGSLTVEFNSVLSQEAAVENLGQSPLTVTLNESAATLPPGAVTRVAIERTVPEDATGYDPDFADEPEYEGEIDASTPY